jgi:hypothetical protein
MSLCFITDNYGFFLLLFFCVLEPVKVQNLHFFYLFCTFWTATATATEGLRSWDWSQIIDN